MMKVAQRFGFRGATIVCGSLVACQLVAGIGEKKFDDGASLCGNGAGGGSDAACPGSGGHSANGGADANGAGAAGTGGGQPESGALGTDVAETGRRDSGTFRGDVDDARGLTDAADGAPTRDADAHAECNDGVKQGDELCDDGNAVEVDGCKSNCEFSDGLRAHWRFDDLTGQVASEERGQYPAPLHGSAVFTSLGKVKGAVRLTQTPDPSFVELENFTINRTAGSISVWVQTTLVGATEPQAVVWGGNGGNLFGGPNNDEFHIQIGGSSGLGCYIGGEMSINPATYCRVIAAEPYVPFVWYHAVMTYRDLEVAPKCKFYVDGEEIVTALATPLSAVYESPDPHDFSGWLPSMYVGRPQSFWRWLYGSVDELLVFDRELSAHEVRALYEAQQ